MKILLYWLCAILIGVAGIYLASLIKIQPPSSAVVPYAQYDTPESFGGEIYRELVLELKDEPLIFLGVTPGQIEDMELWRGFFEANQDPLTKYNVIAVEPMLPYVELFESNLRIDVKDQMDRFVQGIQKSLQQGLRVAVIVPSIYSSQLLKENPAARLKKEYHLNFMSLSVTKFPTTKEQERYFDPPCSFEDGRDMAGTGDLGCMIINMARKTYAKPIDDNKYSGLMDRITAQDYLILFNRNPGSR